MHHFTADFLRRIGDVNPVDLVPRRHERAGSPVTEAEDSLEDLALGLFKHAELRSLPQEALDLLLRDRRPRERSACHQADERIGRCAQRPHQGTGQEREDFHGPGQPGGDPLRAVKGDPPGNELTQQERRQNEGQEYESDDDELRLRQVGVAIRGTVLEELAQARTGVETCRRGGERDSKADAGD
jgi:hypothetical protein